MVGDPPGASYFVPMTAWFTTPVAGVMARLRIGTGEGGRLRAISVSFVHDPPEDDGGDVDVSAAAAAFDFAAAAG